MWRKERDSLRRWLLSIYSMRHMYVSIQVQEHWGELTNSRTFAQSFGRLHLSRCSECCPSVNHQAAASHIARSGAAEEDHCISDFGRRCNPAHRHRLLDKL